MRISLCYFHSMVGNASSLKYAVNTQHVWCHLDFCLKSFVEDIIQAGTLFSTIFFGGFQDLILSYHWNFNEAVGRLAGFLVAYSSRRWIYHLFWLPWSHSRESWLFLLWPHFCMSIFSTLIRKPNASFYCSQAGRAGPGLPARVSDLAVRTLHCVECLSKHRICAAVLDVHIIYLLAEQAIGSFIASSFLRFFCPSVCLSVTHIFSETVAPLIRNLLKRLEL